MKIELGDDVHIDLPTLIESRLLIQANSGGGKSWAIRRILEQSAGHVQHIVIDPEGEFASLREKYDYVLAAPNGGDTTAEPRYAKLLARRLLELNASAIIDIYELQSHERVRFVKLFLEALINAPKSLWHPALIVLDEAHNYAPQTGSAESLLAVTGLMQRGRKRGFCGVLATQRIAKLNKDAAAEANNKLIGRSALDVDMKRASEELGFTAREDQQQLRKLGAGYFFAFGPAMTYDVTKVHVGPVATSHPKIGGRSLTAPAPTAKIKALLPKLSDLPKEAEQEARDTESLRRELADTRRKLTLAEKTQRVETKPCDHLTLITNLKADALSLREDAQAARAEARTIRSRWGAVAASVARAQALLSDTPDISEAPRPVVSAAPAPRPNLPEMRLPKPSANGEDPDLDGITGGAMRMLQRLAERYPETWTRAQLATLAKVKKSGGTFGAYYSRLTTRGLIAENGGRVSITDTGLGLMGGPPEAPMSHDELIASWRERLTGGARRMLDVLLNAGEHGVPREELAERAEITMSGGTFGAYLSRLTTNGLAEKRGDLVVATDLLLGAA